MPLSRLEIHHLRNIEHSALAPGPGLNLVWGENGSGKSSLLEAIYLLGRARSFRATQPAQLIPFQSVETVVAGTIERDRVRRHQVGIRIARQEREVRLDGRILAASAPLLEAFPVQIIHPVQMALLDGTPRLRRQYLDWGTFHVEHHYLEDLRRCAKALNQRNSLLKRGSPSGLDPWNQELARYGTIVAEARERYVDRLTPCLQETIGLFFGERRVSMQHSRGWKAGQALLSTLQGDVAEDLRQGYTRSGPHRADLALLIDGVPAKTYLSRGQTKLLVYALLLAQARLVENSGVPVCLLIDDLASELDPRNRQRLLELLDQRRTQCFITAVNRGDIPWTLPDNVTMFHVEHGRFSAG